MGGGDNAVGVGLKIVIYLYVPSLGHTLFLGQGNFYVNQRKIFRDTFWSRTVTYDCVSVDDRIIRRNSSIVVAVFICSFIARNCSIS
jgi:hypothetical protein